MNTNDNLHGAPPELLAQAYRIALYFSERGIKDWTLGPIQKRASGLAVRTYAAGLGNTPKGAGRDLSEMLDEDEGIKPVPMEHRDPPGRLP